MSDKLVKVATFVAGLVVGAAMVYLSPPPDGAAAGGAPMGPPLEGAPHDGPPVGKEGGPGAMVGGAGPEGPPLPGTEEGPPPPGAGGEQPGMMSPPPGEQGPPEGAPEGPPPEGSVPEGPPPDGAGPAGPPPQGGSGAWLEDHLAAASSLWTELAPAADAAGQEALASRMRDLASRAPQSGDRPPPLDQVVIYLSDERVLVDQMREAGLDTSAVEAQIAPILR